MSCELLEIPHKLAPYIVEKKKKARCNLPGRSRSNLTEL